MPDADVNKLKDVKELDGPLADRVYDAVKSAILRLDFLPGETIRKSSVCTHLGLSRSPVSDALSRLSGEGLVDIYPQSGSRVSRLSVAAIHEDSFLREALEVAAVRHATEHVTDAMLDALDRNIGVQLEMVEEMDDDTFIATDTAFHEIIMQSTNVSRLWPTVRAVSQNVDRARRLLLPEEGRLAETVAEHSEIVAAIRNRDVAAAEEAMRRHVRELPARLVPLAEAYPDLFSS
ncbi:GntR family transcriptional regulator [Oceanomicrobium pacificus]|uniref:FCD domain-containing protein n=1 Tax=Oceanomicrobium pacificus TaxID=2692916 RepID=A0A6B0TIY7_9RHOB|nr:GntR family transcriptional regulator [Oceanomicrobium pacificus]MXU64370.1 FCD domain-containing protein [Oceanomicrobium pacificus]